MVVKVRGKEMATKVSIICACKQLVDVVDKVVVKHGECPVGGTRYIAQKNRAEGAPPDEVPPQFAELSQNRPGAPKIELLAHGPLGCSEPGCEHPAAYGALVRVNSVPDPRNN